MKALKITLLASLLWAAGCTKTTVSDQDKTYPLKFSVSGLDVSYEPMARNSPAIATRAEDSPALYERFQTLEYFGYLVRTQKIRGTQTYDPALPEEFGNIKAQVPAGNYYFGFFGIAPGIGNHRISIGAIMGDNDYLENTGREIWYKELRSFAVSEETENVEIGMTRLTGRLVLDITDQAPESVKKITTGFYFPTRYVLSYGTGGAKYTNPIQQVSELTILDNKVALFEFNSFPINGTSLIISIYGEGDVLLDEKDIRISTYENRKTIVKRELFNGIDSKDFLITVSDDWGEDNVIDL